MLRERSAEMMERVQRSFHRTRGMTLLRGDIQLPALI
jgi:hypothetical protein